MDKSSLIRNISIIAHIDHGKSTLADRLIEFCTKGDVTNQVLDSMDIERERGITIKAQTVRLEYSYKGKVYEINILDTPGHVDFSYEVNRALAACEGSILVVDATQGVEAQTLANLYKAINNNHEIILALNKIDLPAARPDEVKQEVEDIVGTLGASIEVSAKSGFGVDKLLTAIIDHLPSPQITDSSVLSVLIIDSWYDGYLGVITLVRVVSGELKKDMQIKTLSTQSIYKIQKVGIFAPEKKFIDTLEAGSVGFVISNIKAVKDCKIGDTITTIENPCSPLPGFQPSKPVVFCGVYPINSGQFKELETALAKLNLNDSSFSYNVESLGALGYGFRCGFLGLLHLEVIQERITREFNIDLILTAPSVVYKINKTNDETIYISSPSEMPNVQEINQILEPWIDATIVVPSEYLGNVIELCKEKRGIQKNMSYLNNRYNLEYELPLNEVIYDFYDQVKSRTKGYASLDWEFKEYRVGDLIKLSILINGEPVESLSVLLHRSRSVTVGRAVCKKLTKEIPKQLFQIPIQAAIGGKIIARENIKAARKDVTAKCYGGDISRKKKLLEKQKKGKKKMRMIGKVPIPQSTFVSILKLDT